MVALTPGGVVGTVEKPNPSQAVGIHRCPCSANLMDPVTAFRIMKLYIAAITRDGHPRGGSSRPLGDAGLSRGAVSPRAGSTGRSNLRSC